MRSGQWTPAEVKASKSDLTERIPLINRPRREADLVITAANHLHKVSTSQPLSQRRRPLVIRQGSLKGTTLLQASLSLPILNLRTERVITLI